MSELPRQPFDLIIIGDVELLSDPVDPIGNPRKPGREHVEQRRYSGQKKYWSQRHLDDVGDRVEAQSGIVDGEHRRQLELKSPAGLSRRVCIAAQRRSTRSSETMMRGLRSVEVVIVVGIVIRLEI